MAAILFPLTDDMAGALRATLNTRLYEVERHLSAVPQVYGDDQRVVYAKQLRTLLAGLEGSISKSLRKFSPGASDDGEIGFGEPEAGLLKSGENGVDLAQGGSLAGLSHETLPAANIAESVLIAQLRADLQDAHQIAREQNDMAIARGLDNADLKFRVSDLESALRSQVAAFTRVALATAFPEQYAALVRTAPVPTQAASIEQNPISPEQSNQSGKGE